MVDYYDFDATPCEEPCAQTGSNEYDHIQMQKIEIEVFLEHIQRNIGKPPKGFIRWKKAANPHDFGTYYTLQVVYDENTAGETFWNWINKIDSIQTWDRQDLQSLQDKGYAMEKILGEDRLFKAPQL